MRRGAGRLSLMAGWLAFSSVPAQIPLDLFQEKQEAEAEAATAPASLTDRASLNERLVVIDGDRGAGSGFLAEMGGETVLLTNTHVLAGNSRFQARTLGGDPLDLTGMEIAEGYDLARLSQSTVDAGFPIAEDVEQLVKLGDPVVVFGNSAGSGVVTELPGRVTGIGPELLEVDAKFVVGNSGSPVLHLPSGKVIGIATFTVVRTFEGAGEDSRFQKRERRFAYRLDNVPGWEKLSWGRFRQQAGALAAIGSRTQALWSVAEDILKENTLGLPGGRYDEDPRVQQHVEAFFKDLSRPRLGETQFRDARSKLVRALLFELRNDIEPLQPSQLSAYFRRKLAEEEKQREVLRQFFEYLRDSIREERR